MITWAFSHVLREYVIKVLVMQDGQVVEVDASTGLEQFRFDSSARPRRWSARSRRACRASSTPVPG